MMTTRFLILTALMLAPIGGTVFAQTTAKVIEVNAVGAAIGKTSPPTLLVFALGTVSDGGWENGELIPYIYVKPPQDGIWDFDFVASRKPGIHTQALAVIPATAKIKNVPDWVKGVRVHASNNELEALVGEPLELNTLTEEKFAAAASELKIKARYERSGSRHCVVADVTVKLHGFEKSFEAGRFCIAADGDCVDGVKELGSGVKLKWELCVEDDELCLSAEACKSFPIVGELCTSRATACVDLPRAADKE